MMQEIWKDIKGYEGKYQVSNIGRVKSLARTLNKKRMGTPFEYKLPEKIIAQGSGLTGYKIVSLADNTIYKTHSVHRLVAMAFIENNDNKLFVNHKDFNKSNNNIDNLEWVTRDENVDHAHRNGKYISNRRKFSNKQVIDIFLDKGSLSQLATKYNTHKTTIGKIKNKITYAEAWA